ncbi:MAG: Maf family protein [Desulfohalobiaceae bacterium]
MMHDYSEAQGPFRNSKELILASKSPRRQRLLASLGLHFRVQPSLTQEPKPASGKDPERYCRDMARFKATSAAGKQTKGVVLAADTIVVLKGEILGKPADSLQALQILRRLNGTMHEVITGCFLQDTFTGQEKEFSVVTRVNMGQIQDDVLQGYIWSQKPLDKAGSYGIQDLGGALINSIQGSYSNVVGLPMHEVLQALLELDALQLEEAP